MNKELMRAAGLGATVDAVEKGLCPFCLKAPGEFRDEPSRKEFGISGLCQRCQDETFKDNGEDYQMDDFTARHFQAWVEEKFRPELVPAATARMLAVYRDDPEWWDAQGWPSLATAADAWSVDDPEEVE